MIIIHSSHNDTSTNDVLDWLYYLENSEINRLNDEISIDSLEIDNVDIRISAGDNNIDLSAVTSYWYRRGIMKSKEKKITNTSAYTSKLSIPLLNEIDRIYSNADFFKGKNSIGKYSDNSIDKIQMLIAAKRTGLKIPKTLITGSPGKLEEFILKCHFGVITKAIDISNVTIEANTDFHRSLSLSTRIINKENFKHLSFDFAVPAHFQEYIEKKFEIRIFYLKETFFSMAIFSQQNEKTKVDFRHYDEQYPNRMVPYNRCFF